MTDEKVNVVWLGSPTFPNAAHEALKDEQLRRNLKHATTTIRDKRLRAIAELDDWETLRLAGSQIKNRVMRHLDEYLLQLEASVTAAGGVVHWAADAAEANRIVVDLVQAKGTDEVVKIKSMAA